MRYSADFKILNCSDTNERRCQIFEKKSLDISALKRLDFGNVHGNAHASVDLTQVSLNVENARLLVDSVPGAEEGRI